jgi:uncharacterized protein (TIGR00730 family)
MKRLSSICVYCGASTGNDPDLVAAAEQLGRMMAERRVRLVYGGGGIGLMGVLAHSVIDHGGEVLGVIPDFLTEIEMQSDKVTNVVVTSSMHERKQHMFEAADAFVALPGGVGTIEETIEMITWAQLGRHRKPIVLANLKGFWDPFMALIDHVIQRGFAEPGTRQLLRAVPTVEGIFDAIEEMRAAPPVKTRVPYTEGDVRKM